IKKLSETITPAGIGFASPRVQTAQKPGRRRDNPLRPHRVGRRQGGGTYVLGGAQGLSLGAVCPRSCSARNQPMPPPSILFVHLPYDAPHSPQRRSLRMLIGIGESNCVGYSKRLGAFAKLAPS